MVDLRIMSDKKGKSPLETTEQLWDRWYACFADIMSGVPAVLLPMREVNHCIPLVDKERMYLYWMLRCLNALKPQLMEKLQKYEEADWWVHATVW